MAFNLPFEIKVVNKIQDYFLFEETNYHRKFTQTFTTANQLDNFTLSFLRFSNEIGQETKYNITNQIIVIHCGRLVSSFFSLF